MVGPIIFALFAFVFLLNKRLCIITHCLTCLFVCIMESTLEKIYHDPAHPGGLSGVIKLQQAAKEVTGTLPPKQVVKDFLHGEDVYTLHAPALKHFARNRVIVEKLLTPHGLKKTLTGAAQTAQLV